MTTLRQQYEALLKQARERGVRNAHIDPHLLAAADAYDAGVASGALSPERLQIIVDAASHPRLTIWRDGIRILRLAIGRWPNAVDAILRMSQNKKAHARVSAIYALGSETPAHVIDAVLIAGLKDKSARVRWTAADCATRLRKADLVQELRAVLALEPHPKVRRTIQYALDYLTTTPTPIPPPH